MMDNAASHFETWIVESSNHCDQIEIYYHMNKIWNNKTTNNWNDLRESLLYLATNN